MPLCCLLYLQPVASAAMSWPTFLSLSVNSTPGKIRLSFQQTLSLAVACFWSQWRVFSGVNVWVDKGASLTPASSTVWTVCTCVHCLRVCVRPKGVCLCVYVCARLFVLYCVFIPMTWPPCSLKGSGNTMGAPPFSFLISLFFSLSLYVTPQQINSLLILISQEITYLLSITSLLSLFLFAHTEHAHILLHAFFSLSASVSLNCTHACLHTHTHKHTQTQIQIYSKTQLHALIGSWMHINIPSGDSLLMHTH